jgi:hypothetical protein
LSALGGGGGGDICSHEEFLPLLDGSRNPSSSYRITAW